MYRGLRGSMGTLDNANPTRLPKRHQMSPYTQEHKVATNNRPITQEPVESSPWPHGIITKNSSLVRRKKPYMEKSGKIFITKKQDWQPSRK